MIMPLKPVKKTIPGVKANASSAKTLPKKATTKYAGKPSTAGKKAAQKAPKGKAGYELYSSDSEDHQQECGDGLLGHNGPLRTMVEEWMARQAMNEGEGIAGETMSHTVERHGPGNLQTATPFNKRLVSSTPDPDRLLEDDDMLMIPEHDTDEGPGGEAMSTQLMDACGREGDAAAMLSESERQRVRQQLDAALIEEALAKNKVLQEQWKGMQNKPQSARAARPASVVPASASGGGQQPGKRKVGSMADLPRRLQSAQGNRPQDSAANQPASITGDSRGAGATVPGQQVDDGAQSHTLLTPAASTWRHIMANGPEPRGSDIGTFHHFLNRDSVHLPPHFLQKADHTKGASDAGGSGSPSKHGLPNTSMGFTPYGGNQTAAIDQLVTGTGPSSSSGGSEVQPLTVVIDDPVSGVEGQGAQSIHIATPACSPVRASVQFAAPKPSVYNPQNTNASTVSQAGLFTSSMKQPLQELRTPSTSPTRSGSHGVLSDNVANSERPVSSSPVKPKLSSHSVKSNKSGKRRASADNYTCDGYFINSSEDVGKENIDEASRMRPRTPNPESYFHEPSTGTQQGTTTEADLNSNNNSDTYSREQNTNQNMHDDAIHSYTRTLQDLTSEAVGASQPRREEMAEMKTSMFPLKPVAELLMEDELYPPAPVRCPMLQPVSSQEILNGPRQLRTYLSELKRNCAGSNDLKMRHLIQQINDLVELLPQLRVTFNLQAEIALALQPLRTESSQLRRRLRILNQQLKQREKQEHLLLDPKTQFEILSLQTENLTLQKKLSETDASYKKLTSTAHRQQKEILSLHKELALKDHEMVLDRQEQVQQMNRLTQEVENMSRRNQSLQSKLAAADCQLSVGDVTLKQKNVLITQLQDTMGEMKQAVTEVMQFISRSQGDVSTLNTRLNSMPSYRKLHNLVNSTPYVRHPDYDISVSSSRGPLDVSGNQRIPKPSRPDRNENVSAAPFTETGQKQKTVDFTLHGSQSPRNAQNTKDSFDAKPKPLTKDSSHSKELSLLSEASLSTRSVPPSPLTVAAVAAHNHNLAKSEQSADDLSLHSWDGGEQQQAQSGNRSLPYHSDPESAALPSRSKYHHHSRIRKWSSDVRGETQTAGEGKQTSPVAAFDNKPDINQTKTDAGSEEATVPTLSEYPISETESGVPVKPADPATAGDQSRHSVTDYFRKYPESTQLSETSPSPEAASAQNTDEVISTTARESSEKETPTISSPNSSLMHSASNTTQKDHFHGTELDISLSTIQEDGLSTITGLTGASISTTALSLDGQKFKEGISTLDQKIGNVAKSLQNLKKTFS